MVGRIRKILDWNDIEEVWEYSYEVDDDDLVVVDAFGNAVSFDKLMENDHEHE